MPTTTTTADAFPRTADYQGRDRGAIAEIRFGAGYVSVQKRSRVIDGVLVRFRGSEMFDYAEGESAIECARRVARIFASRLGGEVEIRCVLHRVAGGCELPNPAFERFGWTRETRGVGEVSVIPDVFLVF